MAGDRLYYLRFFIDDLLFRKFKKYYEHGDRTQKQMTITNKIQ